MAVKIKLTRLGKIRNAQYRVVIADSRTRRDGRAIETIGKYHPKEEPSLIDIDSERAQYWLSVGAQPTEPVEALLKITGDWQKFKGLPGTKAPCASRKPSPPSSSSSRLRSRRPRTSRLQKQSPPRRRRLQRLTRPRQKTPRLTPRLPLQTPRLLTSECRRR